MLADRRHKRVLLFLTSVIVGIILLGIVIEVIGYVGIHRTAQQIVKESPSEEMITKNLLSVVDDIITDTYDPLLLLNPLCRRFYAKRANLIFVIRRGACEEHAELFAKLAKASSIQCKIVRAPGEDHVWNEVIVNGSPKRVDATLKFPSSFDNFSYYESPEGWNWKLSKVYSNVDGRRLGSVLICG